MGTGVSGSVRMDSSGPREDTGQYRVVRLSAAADHSVGSGQSIAATRWCRGDRVRHCFRPSLLPTTGRTALTGAWRLATGDGRRETGGTGWPWWRIEWGLSVSLALLRSNAASVPSSSVAPVVHRVGPSPKPPVSDQSSRLRIPTPSFPLAPLQLRYACSVPHTPYS